MKHNIHDIISIVQRKNTEHRNLYQTPARHKTTYFDYEKMNKTCQTSKQNICAIFFFKTFSILDHSQHTMLASVKSSIVFS